MIYYCMFIFTIILIVFILNLVKKNKIDEKYSILWFVFSLILLIVSIFPSIVSKIAEKIGVYYPPSLLFLIGFCIVGMYIIHITITITKQNKMIVKLTQEISIFKEKVENEIGEKE